MPCRHFGAFSFHFHSILLPIFLLIFLPIFAINPLESRQTDEHPQQQKLLTNEHLIGELASLERQIEKINSSISAFFAQQQRQSKGQEIEHSRGERQEMEMDKAKLERLKMEKEMLEGILVENSTNGTGGNNETNGPEIKKANSPSSMVSDASRLLCQFFVFGILFGVVCSISACSCLFRSRRNAVGSARNCAQSVEEANFNRLSQIREPFAPDKPYCLKFDERGLCYASPLTREVPPLPNYEQACRMPTAAEIAGHNNKGTTSSTGGAMGMAANLQRAMTVRKAQDQQPPVEVAALRVV